MKIEFHTGCHLTQEPYIIPSESYRDKYWIEYGTVLELEICLIEEDYYEIQLLNYLDRNEFRKKWFVEKQNVTLIDSKARAKTPEEK